VRTLALGRRRRSSGAELVPDSKKLVLTDKRLNLWLVDIETRRSADRH